jgi:hypothetical protein
MAGISTTLGLYKFYNKCAGNISREIIRKGYSIHISPAGGREDIMMDGDTFGSFYRFIERLELPNDRKGMKDQIYWRVIENLRDHSKGKKITYQ